MDEAPRAPKVVNTTGLKPDEIDRVYGLLQHEAMPLVIQVVRKFVAECEAEVRAESTSWDRVNVLRGRIQAFEEVVGTLGLVIPSLYAFQHQPPAEE